MVEVVEGTAEKGDLAWEGAFAVRQADEHNDMFCHGVGGNLSKGFTF